VDSINIKRSIFFLTVVGVVVVAISVYAFNVSQNVDQVEDVVETPVEIPVEPEEVEEIEAEEVREIEVDLLIEEPISILLLGVDRGEFGETGQGLADSIIVVTINPEEETMKMISIPRDTRTEIVGMDFDDKINHAYAFGGIEMIVNTAQSLLDIPIDYYVRVDMVGLQALVEAVGGIEVENDFDFTFEGVHFPLGTVYLNGADALSFSRMRYEDPRGDFGRQERQRLVIEALINELMSLSNIAQFTSILDTAREYVETDIVFDDVAAMLFGGYRGALENIEQLQLLVGEGQTINGIYYQILSDEEIANASAILRTHLGLDVDDSYE